MRHVSAYVLVVLALATASFRAVASHDGRVSATLSDMTPDYSTPDEPARPTAYPHPVGTAFAEWTANAATARAVELATYYATTYTPTLTVTSTPTMGATLTVTATPTDAATPVLFPCRFEPGRCRTRIFAPFNGKGRRR